MTAIIRKLRHWKQRFDPDAEMVFRRASNYDGVQYNPGEKIPDALKNNKRKLQLMWDAKKIELAVFEAPASTVPPINPVPAEPAEKTLPENYTLEQNGNWFNVTNPDGEKTKMLGKKKLAAYIESLDAE